ncbi:MAG: MotA/TolQ/ExbB proton channel family protein [Zetaproteobacteria bacterium]|nr:MAG: MotA/TolQ/ExbB proton channel family protein [Zetaproteobacteria bacterium]
MYEFLVQGGAVMFILLGCSILALTIIFERSWSLRRSVVIPKKDVDAVEAAIRSEDVKQAMRICRDSPTAMGRILWVALENRGVSRPVLKEVLEETGRQEVAHLDRFIGALGLIAAISPLLGLLGTVIGMIEVFQVISVEGVGKADVLAGGISKALNTTAAGLSVAIPALVAFRLLEARVDRFVIEIEQHALRFVELLKGER